LRSKEGAARRAAAETLQELGWQPGAEDLPWVALARQDWEAIEKLGAGASEALMTGLRDSKPKIRLQAAQCLGRLESAGIAPLVTALADPDREVRQLAGQTLRRISPDWKRSSEARGACAELASRLWDAQCPTKSEAANTLAQLGWEPADDSEAIRYALIRRHWDGLAKFGATAVAELAGALEDGCPMVRSLAVEALGRTGDANAVDPLMRGLFVASWTSSDLARAALLALAPVSALNETLIGWAVEAAGFQHKTRGWSYDQGYISHESANAAVRKLCSVDSPVTSNILRLVSQKKDVVFSHSTGCGVVEFKVEFADQRATALQELARRGDPPYAREAYLPASGDTGRRDAQIGEALAAERRQRYSTLMRRLDRPRTELGENQFTYLEELARDFPTTAVFERMVLELARRQTLTLGERNRFETLLSLVGAKLGQAEVEARLAPLKAPWPRIREAVLENGARPKKGG
jgi:hypothetical protein